MEQLPISPGYSAIRIASWLVMALTVLAIAYIAYISLVNWDAISV